MDIFMHCLYAFLVGGFICLIGQILIDYTKLTPARILVSYVVAGVILTAIGIYEPIVKFAGAGATVPLTGFGYSLACGVKEAVKEFDSANYGGAPLLGINGLVAKVHGSSKASEVKNAVTQCMDFSKMHIKELIKENITVEE